MNKHILECRQDFGKTWGSIRRYNQQQARINKKHPEQAEPGSRRWPKWDIEYIISDRTGDYAIKPDGSYYVDWEASVRLSLVKVSANLTQAAKPMKSRGMRGRHGGRRW